MKWLIVIVALLSSACDAEVKRVQLPTHVEQRVLSCSTPGICGGFNHDGDYTFGFHTSCDGHRQATVLVKPYEVTFESGSVRQYEDTVTQSYQTSCQQ